MITPKFEKIIRKASQQCGEDEALVRELVDKLFKEVNEYMQNPRFPDIRVPGLGAFYARPRYVEEEIEILLLKLKNSKKPNTIKDRLDIMNLASKRIRNERKVRRMRAVARVAGAPKGGLRKT